MLEPTVDILAELGDAKRGDQVVVGFAAETEQLRERAAAKLAAKRVDLMVANDVSAPDAGFEVDTNRAVLLDAAGVSTRRRLLTKDRARRRHPRPGRASSLAGSAAVGATASVPLAWRRESARSEGKLMSRHTFTSESVTEGHPDKMADQISDSVLDAVLTEDPYGRVACETMVTTGLCVVAGEISTKAHIDFSRLARDTICAIGYTDAAFGIDGKTCGVIVSIDEQSPDIAMGVDKAIEQKAGTGDLYDEVGAGDQGMMFGYACDDTDALMPMPIWLAHRLPERLAQVRKERIVDFLRPDGKTQVSIEYEDGVPKRLDTVLISTQHAPEHRHRQDDAARAHRARDPAVAARAVRRRRLRDLREPHRPVRARRSARRLRSHRPQDHRRHLRRHGPSRRRRVLGQGPDQGRPLGGLRGAPDREGRRGRRVWRKRCEAQVAYAIGVAHPVSIMVDTFGTSEIAPDKLEAMVRDVFDMRPAAIIERLDLRRPIYRRTAAYGHFGRTDGDGFTWENVEPYAAELRRAAWASREACAPRLSRRPRRHRGRPRLRLLVPDALATLCASGAIVRVPLHGRRVRGWVVADDVEPESDGAACSTCWRSCPRARPPMSSR